MLRSQRTIDWEVDMRTTRRTRSLWEARVGLATLGVFVGLLVTPSEAVASPGVVPDPTDGVNGEVYASVQVGDRTFIGGTFSWAGPSTASAVPVDATTGKRLSVPKVRGLVRVAVPDGAGAGSSAATSCTPGERYATAQRESTLRGSSPAGTPHPPARCTPLAVANGVVYLGFFSQMGGQARSNIAAVDATSGALLSWNPGANGSVSSLAVCADGTTVYAGGTFSGLGSQQRSTWEPSTR